MYNFKDILDQHVIFCPKPDNIFQSGTNAELLTVKTLALNLLPEKVGDYRILVNYNIALIEPGMFGTLEVDILLIHKYGVFLLEVKDWSGIIDAYADHWLKDKKEFPNPYIKVNDKARILHNQITNILGGRRIGVRGAVVLAKGKENFKPRVDDKWKALYEKAVVGLESSDLIRLVNERDSGGRELSDKQISDITDKLYKRHQSVPRIIIDDKYMIVGEKRYESDIYEEYEAVDLNMPSDLISDIAEPINRVRIKVYHLDKMNDLDKEEVSVFRRCAEAVRLMGHHENVVYIQSFFPDREKPFQMYEITDFIVGKRMDEILVNHKARMSLRSQLEHLIPVCRALERAHNFNIVHRYLSPASVFVDRNGNIKLDDWNYARISGAKTILVDKASFKGNIATAPEVRSNPSFASPASDVFSLGVLWFLLASLPSHVEHVEHKNITSFGLPPEAQMLLSSMLSSEINRRPRHSWTCPAYDE